jgi:pyridoxine 5-phosphate synthase
MRLGVNIDHVATLRQARKGRYPDPVAAASIAELAGAGQITLHVREDRRHVNDRDLRLLRQTVNGLLNLEMAATDAMVSLALEVGPDIVTLVPEKREELTTEGGLDVLGHEAQIARVTAALQGAGIEVSLFIDPDAAQIAASKHTGAKAIELHTGRYCDAGKGDAGDAQAVELARIAAGAQQAAALGLRVAAGHGLDYWNVGQVAALPEITELNIGYSIVCRAVLLGLERAVRDMKELIG